MKRSRYFIIAGFGLACVAFGGLQAYVGSYVTWAENSHLHCPYSVQLKNDTVEAVCPHHVVVFNYAVPHTLAASREKLLAAGQVRQ